MTHPHNIPGLAAGDQHSLAAGPAGPGVPLTVWPVPPHAGCGPRPCAGPVALTVAAKIITAFSWPGDLVAVLDGCPAATEAAAAAGRRVLALIPAVPGERAGGGPPGRGARAVRVRPGGPEQLLAPGDPDAGQAALAITGCCDPGCRAAPGPGAGEAALVFAAAQRVLWPGGVLAVRTASHPPGDDQPSDLAGHAVAAARAAGLIYAQHIVLVHAAISGDHLDPEPLPASQRSQPGGSRIHSDLLVFTKHKEPAHG